MKAKKGETMTTTGKALETLFEICEESNASDLHLAVIETGGCGIFVTKISP